MESHQIPKNVTEFEFHLVGDMTLKQFMYLATGLGLAYLTFVLFAVSIPFIAYPLIVIFASIGLAMAFLPIMEQPLDHWVKAYMLAIFSPTQRLFNPTYLNLSSMDFGNRLNRYLLDSITQDTQKLPGDLSLSQITSVQKQNTQPFLPPPAPITQNAQPQPSPIPQNRPTPKPGLASKLSSIPSSGQLHKSVELAQQSQIIQAKIIDTQKVLDQIKAQAAVAGVKSNQFTEQFQLTLARLQQLSKQQAEISRDLAILSESHPSIQSKKVVINPKTTSFSDTQLILTAIPNMISGIVTDNQGNYLEGVIVVTHDKQGLPVRALKSNKLGQFLAATPLGNGTYSISLEKEGFAFDILELTLDGSVIPPIRVTAKQGGVNG